MSWAVDVCLPSDNVQRVSIAKHRKERENEKRERTISFSETMGYLIQILSLAATNCILPLPPIR